MTDERMALIELIEKQADSDFVRDMLAFAADRIMEMEVEAETEDPWWEKDWVAGLGAEEGTEREEEEAKETALRQGAVAYLRKPFDRQEFLDCVQAAISQLR